MVSFFYLLKPNNISSFFVGENFLEKRSIFKGEKYSGGCSNIVYKFYSLGSDKFEKKFPEEKQIKKVCRLHLDNLRKKDNLKILDDIKSKSDIKDLVKINDFKDNEHLKVIWIQKVLSLANATKGFVKDYNKKGNPFIDSYRGPATNSLIKVFCDVNEIKDPNKLIIGKTMKSLWLLKKLLKIIMIKKVEKQKE